MLLSDGWFRGRHGFQRHADGFGTRTGLLLAISDPAATRGPSVATDEQLGVPTEPHPTRRPDGRAVDRLQRPRPGLVHQRRLRRRLVRRGARTGRHDPPGVTARTGRGQPVRQIAEIAPTGLTRPRPGTVVLDLGEEINGWMRLPELGPAGTRLTLTHGEVLDAAGLVTTENLRAFDFETRQLLDAGQQDEVISSGRGEIFEPRHTTHGFRYVQIDGVPAGLDLTGATGVQVHTVLDRTGEFSCSDPRLEQLHEVVRRSLLTNACAVPTDCPQRERSGFTGDWQIFAGTAALLHDVAWFSRRWLRDLAADQWSDGRIPTIVPNPGGDQPSGSPVRGRLRRVRRLGRRRRHRALGDVAELRRPRRPARGVPGHAALGRLLRAPGRHRPPSRPVARRPRPAPHETYLLDTGFHFGEWLEPGVPPSPDPTVDHGIVATAYLHRSALLTARTAQLLGHSDAAVGLPAHRRRGPRGLAGGVPARRSSDRGPTGPLRPRSGVRPRPDVRSCRAGGETRRADRRHRHPPGHRVPVHRSAAAGAVRRRLRRTRPPAARPYGIPVLAGHDRGRTPPPCGSGGTRSPPTAPPGDR